MQTVFTRAGMPLFEWKEWTLYCPKDIPSQISRDKSVGLNCGVHASLWAYIICTSQEIHFTQLDMDNARRWILKKIIDAEKIDFKDKLTCHDLGTANKKVELCQIDKITVFHKVPMGAQSTIKYLAYLKYMG